MKYEYRHERIQATVEREVQVRNVQSKQQVYSEQVVEDALNKLGQDGWELVNMEPKWVYRSSRHTMEAVEPEIIECWYATFKRPLEQ